MSETDADEPVSRRGFLRTAAGTAAVAGASGTAAAQEGEGGGGGATEVTVGPGGSLTFDPETATIAPGSAVKFVWDSGGHNVNPDDGDWGHQPIEDSGFSFTTPPFEETGSFGYVCDPHEPAGMIGTIEVSEGGGGGGSSEPAVPNSAKTLGIAAMSFMLSTLGLAYVFMKYGGDYENTSEE
ncbi:plastocyanin/azurin family copper-binding protein [Halococcus agarilyticus]|uniref:plastocyanin/azurin family copper-binding protein n=1 Tax=Halococcus agarilyticus TaxID=1232219 RepID=UPI0006780931|nr:plastocyanin/azurin family copper-binding protein [Halococcus agarilyticus]